MVCVTQDSLFWLLLYFNSWNVFRCWPPTLFTKFLASADSGFWTRPCHQRTHQLAPVELSSEEQQIISFWSPSISNTSLVQAFATPWSAVTLLCALLILLEITSIHVPSRWCKMLKEKQYIDQCQPSSRVSQYILVASFRTFLMAALRLFVRIFLECFQSISQNLYKHLSKPLIKVFHCPLQRLAMILNSVLLSSGDISNPGRQNDQP